MTIRLLAACAVVLLLTGCITTSQAPAPAPHHTRVVRPKAVVPAPTPIAAPRPAPVAVAPPAHHWRWFH